MEGKKKGRRERQKEGGRERKEERQREKDRKIKCISNENYVFIFVNRGILTLLR